MITINLSKITKKQWGSIGKVALFLLASLAVAAATVYLTNDIQLAAPVTVVANLVLVTLGKIFQQDEQAALDQLPRDIAQPVSEAASVVSTEVRGRVIPAPAIQSAIVSSTGPAVAAVNKAVDVVLGNTPAPNSTSEAPSSSQNTL